MATEGALKAGIAATKSGARLGDISAAIQYHAESRGFSVVREYVGHGIGREMHEEPQVPNFGVAGQGVRPGGAAMGQINEELQSVFDDLPARPRIQIDNEANAAGIVLAERIVESLCWRLARPGRLFRTRILSIDCHSHIETQLPNPPRQGQALAGRPAPPLGESLG